MCSQQMRRKGPWERREEEKEGGLGCPGPGGCHISYQKAMHKLPAAVLAKLHFNHSSPEAIISSLIASATAHRLLPHRDVSARFCLQLAGTT